MAIDRTSKFAFVELHREAGKMIAAVPYAIHTVLTDNGKVERMNWTIKEARSNDTITTAMAS